MLRENLVNMILIYLGFSWFVLVQVLVGCNKSHVVATGQWDKHEHLAGGR